MKRLFIVSAFFALCLSLTGCGGDTNEKLITDTITRMGIAATEVGNIKARVDDALKKVEKGESLDLSEAMEATIKLKETGAEFQRLKQRIEQLRSQVTEQDRKVYADNQRGKLNTAFKALIDNREELRKALLEAEKHGKAEVTKLRAKITDAESPFEALSR